MGKELAKTGSPALLSQDSGQFQNYMDTTKFEHCWRVANLLSKSELVPTQYRNKPENCFLAFNAATRLNIDPIMFMQKTYVIHGRQGMEAQLAIALANERGPFDGPIQWEFFGEGKERGCTAFATDKATGNRCEATVTWKMAELEGWTRKDGSKWLTIPDLMFRYRSAVFLIRLYCPEVILGFETVDEIVDTKGREKPQAEVSGLESRLSKPVENEAQDAPESPVVDDVLDPHQLTDEDKEWMAANLAPSDEAVDEPAESQTDAVFEECRFYCQNCDFEADIFKPKVVGKQFKGWLCPKCLSDKVIDRKPKDEKEES
jgi:hypothetical protein